MDKRSTCRCRREKRKLYSEITKNSLKLREDGVKLKHKENLMNVRVTLGDSL